MSEGQDTTPPVEEIVDTGGFVKPITAEQADQWSADWTELKRRRRAAQPTPPMANVRLSRELAGAAEIREHEFQGTTYRFRPIPYASAIALLDLLDKMERIAALAKVADLDQTVEHLREVRGLYVAIGELAATLLDPPVTGNPFIEGWEPDYQALCVFLLDSGREKKRGDDDDDPRTAYDAAHQLVAWLDQFGATRAMIDEQGAPRSWRHFIAGCAYMRRHRAEEQIQQWWATADLNWESRQSWIADLKREAER